VTLQGHWQMMGALEAVDGVLLFGISTAYIFALMQTYWPMLSAVTDAAPSLILMENRNRCHLQTHQTALRFTSVSRARMVRLGQNQLRDPVGTARQYIHGSAPKHFRVFFSDERMA
jgi:hypothetical protein